MKEQLLEQLSSGTAIALSPVNISDSLISLFFAGLFGLVISNSYRYSSQSLSGGRQVVSSLLPLSLTVCVIITVVKSSLALSLGLVGALSIVRFRTPVKDPEDLVFLFLSIVTGLGFGANQNIYTSIGVGIILLTLNFRSYIVSKKNNKFKSRFDFNLNIEWHDNDDLSLSNVITLLSESCNQISFVRFDRNTSLNNLVVQVGLMPNITIDILIKSINNSLGDKVALQIYSSALEY